MMDFWFCNECGFTAPADDHIGTALMREHQRTEHGVSMPLSPSGSGEEGSSDG